MDNPVGWFEMYVQDMPRAQAFYENVLGKTLSQLGDPGMNMMAFPGKPDGSGATGTLVKMDGAPTGPGGTLVYFVCDDCAVEAGKAAKAGGRVHREKTSIGEFGFIAHVFDTEGNMVGLHSMR